MGLYLNCVFNYEFKWNFLIINRTCSKLRIYNTSTIVDVNCLIFKQKFWDNFRLLMYLWWFAKTDDQFY